MFTQLDNQKPPRQKQANKKRRRPIPKKLSEAILLIKSISENSFRSNTIKTYNRTILYTALKLRQLTRTRTKRKD